MQNQSLPLLIGNRQTTLGGLMSAEPGLDYNLILEMVSDLEMTGESDVLGFKVRTAPPRIKAAA